MKKLLLATAAGALLSGAAGAEEIKLGVSLGFTGPLESMAPGMQSGAELAMKEVTDSGMLLDGSTVTSVTGDSTCIDAAAATATVERLITAENVKGIVGGMCSGETIASLENVAKPNGVVTMPTVSAPSSRAMRATTGAAPDPVPPPSPAVTKTMSEPRSSFRI